MIRASFGAAVLLAAAVLLGGCTTTTTRLAPVQGQAAYEIECIREGDCFMQARRACNGHYRTLERHDNWISESDLPSLNQRTNAHGYRPWTLSTAGYPQPYSATLDSDEPLPLTNVVVLCTDG